MSNPTELIQEAKARRPMAYGAAARAYVRAWNARKDDGANERYKMLQCLKIAVDEALDRVFNDMIESRQEGEKP